MSQKILIVEDQFIEANSLKLLLTKEGYTICGVVDTVIKAQELLLEERPDLVLLDIFLKGKLTGIDLAWQLKESGIPFIYISANSNEEVLNLAKATQPDGFVVKPFRRKDILVTLEIAKYRYENNRSAGHRQENDFERQLIEVIKADNDNEQKLLQMVASFQSFIPFDLFSIQTKKEDHPSYPDRNFLRIAFDEYQFIGRKELKTITNISAHEFELLAVQNRSQAGFYNEDTFTKICGSSPLAALVANTFDMRSNLFYPLVLSSGEMCYLSFFSKRPNTYLQEHLLAFSRLHVFITRAAERVALNHLLSADPSPGTMGHFVSGKLVSPTAFDGIIGSSHLLLNVFDQISQVAPSDTSVLILGESGTGKERIADAVHKLSPRSARPIIRVNCAALPSTLIESELFGHEKGSFTGANDKRIGKFEQADTGTIFLDEIGEMPVELQVKLLRVLQEKEIERIGSKAPTKLDVRIIAATSRNLEKEVAEGRFRLDLYYRLNVFPIILPPLRDRKEDIPELISHFITYYSRKTGKDVKDISEKGLHKLVAYSWPGNIRELEHVIERCILTARGSTIEDISLSIVQKKESALPVEEVRIKTIHENERDHILAVLKKCNGKIWGPGAAAELLNIPASTLKSKMNKLGIKKDYMAW